jgi:hypothetical protein
MMPIRTPNEHLSVQEEVQVSTSEDSEEMEITAESKNVTETHRPNP